MKYGLRMDEAESYTRLLLAAKKLKKWDGDAEIIRGLALATPSCEISAARIGNWRTRGVAKDALVDVCKIIGCRPIWIKDGSGVMEDVGAGPDGDDDIFEAISMLTEIHGRLRTKAVAFLQREIRELLEAQQTNAVRS